MTVIRYARRPLHVTSGVLLTLALVTACETQVTDVPVSVARVDVVAARTTLNTGETLQLNATPRSAEGDGLTARPVTWSSSNTAVADVSSTGLVTALTAGSATITATADGVPGSVTLTVIVPPSIAVSNSAVTFTAVASTTNPAPQTVSVTNGGGGTLSGLAVGSVQYMSGSGWLQTALSASTAPATLTLTPSIQGLAAGTYQAIVSLISSVAATRTITVTLTVTPSFTLTVVGGGTANGTVTGSGINCTITAGAAAGVCAQQFAANTVVTLTATPGAQSVFAGWSAGCTATGNTCVATMTVARTITATFNLPSAALTVQGAGNGAGSVQGQGINCTIANGVTSGTCVGSYPLGTNVQLTPTPGAASVFAGWTGPCTINGQVCTVSMSAARSVTARFDAQQANVVLTITGAGNGNGTVTGAGGINCTITAGVASGTCQASFAVGTAVPLTATPASGGHTFGGWGGSCAGIGACNVVMSAARTVSATFTQPAMTSNVTPQSHQLIVGWNWDYTAVLRRADGSVVTGVSPSWSSTNPAVASIDFTGRVTAKAAGVTTIRASYGNIEGDATLTVTADPCAVIPIPASMTITGSLGAASCRPDGRPAQYFGLSSAQQFSARVSTSAPFVPGHAWYTTQSLVPTRFLGGHGHTTALTPLSTMAILPAGSFALEVRSHNGAAGDYTSQIAIGAASPDNRCGDLVVVVPPIDYTGSITASACTDATQVRWNSFYIYLRAGETITVDMMSTAVDSYLEIYNLLLPTTFDNLAAQDDNSGGGQNARVVFTAPTTTLYWLLALTASTGQFGTYRLTVTSNMATVGARALPGPFSVPRAERVPRRGR